MEINRSDLSGLPTFVGREKSVLVYPPTKFQSLQTLTQDIVSRELNVNFKFQLCYLKQQRSGKLLCALKCRLSFVISPSEQTRSRIRSASDNHLLGRAEQDKLLCQSRETPDSVSTVSWTHGLDFVRVVRSLRKLISSLKGFFSEPKAFNWARNLIESSLLLWTKCLTSSLTYRGGEALTVFVVVVVVLSFLNWTNIVINFEAFALRMNGGIWFNFAGSNSWRASQPAVMTSTRPNEHRSQETRARSKYSNQVAQ